MSSKLNIRTGDTVMVITGDNQKDAGKTGQGLSRSTAHCRSGQEHDRPPPETPSAGRIRRKA